MSLRVVYTERCRARFRKLVSGFSPQHTVPNSPSRRRCGHHRVFRLKKRRILFLLSCTMMMTYIFAKNTLFVLAPVTRERQLALLELNKQKFHSNGEPVVNISLDYGDEIDIRRIARRKNETAPPNADLPAIFANNLTTPRLPMNFTLAPWKVLEDLQTPVIGANCEHMELERVFKPKWSLVILLKSRATNFDRRAAVRATWGRLYYLNQVRIAQVFIIGEVEDPDVQKQLQLENEMFGDILQYDGPDGYRNMPLKVSTAMQWAASRLPGDHFYASADDDFVVKLTNIIDFLEFEIKTQDFYERKMGRVSDLARLRAALPIYCVYYIDKAVEPNRDNESKWYISPEEYPADAYPNYCGGGFYLMPVAMASDLYALSLVTRFLPMDDVWVTGILRQKLGKGTNNVIKARWPKDDAQLLWMHLWGDYGKKKKDVGKLMPRILEGWKWNDDVANRPHCERPEETVRERNAKLKHLISR